MASRIAAGACAFMLGFGLWATSRLVVGTLEPWDADGPYYLGVMLLGGAALGVALPSLALWVFLGLWVGQVIAISLPGHDRTWFLLGLITTGIGSLVGLAGYLAGVVAYRGLREPRCDGHPESESTAKSAGPLWLNSLRIGVLRVCWLPPVVWLGSWAYIWLTDHWGAFAAAPLLMASMSLSFALGVIGGFLFSLKAWRGEFDPLLAACSLLAGSAFLLEL